MRAEAESVADRYERMAYMAVMNRAAYHAKKLKHSDLYDRKKSSVPKKSLDEMKAEYKRKQSWLDSLINGKQTEGVNE